MVQESNVNNYIITPSYLIRSCPSTSTGRMAGTKRSISPGDSPDLTGKRARHFDIIEPYKVDDDDDLDSILTRIKEQEQSERLAKQLQDEWNASASSSTDLNASDIESDAALAKRLSMEWNQATPEVIEVEDHSSPEASTPSWAPTRRERSIIDSQSPGEKLALFKDIYTAKRNCTKCGEPVTSPRGFVRLELSCDLTTYYIHAYLPGCILYERNASSEFSHASPCAVLFLSH